MGHRIVDIGEPIAIAVCMVRIEQQLLLGRTLRDGAWQAESAPMVGGS